MDSKLKPAMIGGIPMGLLSAIPLISCGCCVWALGGGILASYMYLKDGPAKAQPDYADGALLGVITAGVALVASLVILIPLQLLGIAGGFSSTQLDQLRDAGLSDDLVGALAGGGAGCIGIVFAAGAYLVLFGIFATVGSLIGTAVFTKKTPPMPGTPV